jgi:hypothetical protein
MVIVGFYDHDLKSVLVSLQFDAFRIVHMQIDPKCRRIFRRNPRNGEPGERFAVEIVVHDAIDSHSVRQQPKAYVQWRTK